LLAHDVLSVLALLAGNRYVPQVLFHRVLDLAPPGNLGNVNFVTPPVASGWMMAYRPFADKGLGAILQVIPRPVAYSGRKQRFFVTATQ
jgi:hypothetical protein